MSVGGKVIEVAHRSDGLKWVNTLDGNQEYAVYVDAKGEDIKKGDTLWWQGGVCYWTPQDESRVEVKLPKMSTSGVDSPDLRDMTDAGIGRMP